MSSRGTLLPFVRSLLLVVAFSLSTACLSEGEEADDDHAVVDDAEQALAGGCRSKGVHPQVCTILDKIGYDLTITQGLADSSYHHRDGSVNGGSYAAAADIRTKFFSDAEKRDLLKRLRDQGFVAWYRHPNVDGWGDHPEHIHAIYPGVRVASEKVVQIKRYLAGNNGLAAEGAYHYMAPTRQQRDAVVFLFGSAGNGNLDVMGGGSGGGGSGGGGGATCYSGSLGRSFPSGACVRSNRAGSEGTWWKCPQGGGSDWTPLASEPVSADCNGKHTR
ncbi:MAG: hypothetical protein KBF88_07570 [Polyangiaceae bacterium]|nr:hypothetical protein [Polyangiaceae bacterium]